MTEPTELTGLTEQLHRIVRPALPAGPFRGVIHWVSVGGPTQVLRPGIPAGAMPQEADAVLREIQARLARPGKGRPYALDVYFDDNESTVGGVDAVWDARVVLDAQLRDAYHRVVPVDEVRPTAEEWRGELELAPREPANIPQWWRELLEHPTGWEPLLPKWYGSPMPQTLPEAEAQPPLRGTPAVRFDTFPGWESVFPVLDEQILRIARQLPDDELDHVFGRRGRAAQVAAQERLAHAAAAAAADMLAGFDGVTGSDMVRRWAGADRQQQGRPASLGTLDQEHKPLGKLLFRRAAAQALLADMQKATDWCATRIVMRRFGRLPKGWHRA